MSTGTYKNKIEQLEFENKVLKNNSYTGNRNGAHAWYGVPYTV